MFVVPEGHHDQLTCEDGSVMVINSTFKQEIRIGSNVVIANSLFHKQCTVPESTQIINSEIVDMIVSPSIESESGTIVYGWRSPSLRLEARAVHFSCHINGPDGSIFAEHGVFPIDVIPKRKEDHIIFDHYNKDSNSGETKRRRLSQQNDTDDLVM